MDRGVSPAGGVEMVSPCGATYFARGGKVGKASPGAAHGHLTMPYPASPGPPFIYGGAIKECGKICPARAKDRIPLLAPPAAAPCWLNRRILLQE